MSIRRVTADITCDDYGCGTEDLNFSPNMTTRLNELYGVRVTTDDSARLQVTLREVDVDDDGEETDGRVIFHVREPRPNVTYMPRIESHGLSVDESSSYPTGETTSEENTLLHVETRSIRVDVDRASADAEVTVDVYVRTAGDYRF